MRTGYHEVILMRAGRHEVICQYVCINLSLLNSFLYTNTNDTITTPVSDIKNSTFFETRDNKLWPSGFLNF